VSDATTSLSHSLSGATTIPGAHDAVVPDTRLDSSPWYGAPLGIALLAAGITVVATQGATALWRWRDRKLRRQGIIAAFAAEMRAAVTELRFQLHRVAESFERNELPRYFLVNASRAVFAANAGSLGELRDPRMAAGIVEAYELLERTNRVGALIPPFVTDQASPSETAQETMFKMGERTAWILQFVLYLAKAFERTWVVMGWLQRGRSFDAVAHPFSAGESADIALLRRIEELTQPWSEGKKGPAAWAASARSEQPK